MKKPRNRRERIDFLTKKLGSYFTQDMVALTDKEVKKFTDSVYENLKDKEDYIASETKSTCIRCGMPVLYHYECGCGYDRAVFDKEDWIDDIKGNTDRFPEDEEFIKENNLKL